MSEVFEGLISKAPVATARHCAEGIAPSLELIVSELAGELSVVYRSDPRSSSVFKNEMQHLAQRMSEKLSEVLMVRYDSRMGYRCSELYSKGKLIKSFTERDELYVPLDEMGDPITTYPPLKYADLVTGEEYETIQNAIELGLAELGKGDWISLKQLIGRV